MSGIMSFPSSVDPILHHADHVGRTECWTFGSGRRALIRAAFSLAGRIANARVVEACDPGKPIEFAASGPPGVRECPDRRVSHRGGPGTLIRRACGVIGFASAPVGAESAHLGRFLPKALPRACSVRRAPLGLLAGRSHG